MIAAGLVTRHFFTESELEATPRPPAPLSLGLEAHGPATAIPLTPK